MSSTATAAQTFSPKLNAEESMLRLLALIRTTQGVGDLTGERLSEHFGVDFITHNGRWGFGERLTRDWWSAMEFDPASIEGPRFEFGFRADPPGTYPPASAICAIDFDRFAAELEAMGFVRETYRGKQNQVIYDSFKRSGFMVRVHTRGEADAPIEKISHACVETVYLV